MRANTCDAQPTVWREEEVFNDGFRKPKGIESQAGPTGNLVTYERLRAMDNNGVQLPVKEYKDGNADRNRNAVPGWAIRHRGW